MEQIGWLESGVPFTQGEVSPQFFSRLVDLLKKPWQPAQTAGFHRCPLCRFNETPPGLCYNGNYVQMGTTNLYIPDKERIFFAPSLIAHYIDAHNFQPPTEFQKAVLECPPMGSAVYYKALRQGGMSLQTIKGNLHT